MHKENVNRSFKRVSVNLGVSLLSLLILFVFLELGFRVIEKLNSSEDPNQIWAIYDPDLGYRSRPNFADLNEHGLRDDPIDSVKTKFRLLFLGDSVPFYGDYAKDTYVGRIETILNSDSQLIPVEVINAGIKGYTNYQELIYLKKYGLQFQPDLVGVSFVLNDCHKFLHQFDVQDGKIVGDTYHFTQDAVQTVKSPLYQIARKSHFLIWLRHQLSIFEKLIELKTSGGGGFTFDYRPDFKTAWDDEAWIQIEKQLEKIVALGMQNGFKVFLVAFPFGEQLREDYLERDFEYITKPQRELKSICERLNIPFLDLFDELDRKKHLLDDQIHLTKEGRELTSTKIAEFLKNHELIPRS